MNETHGIQDLTPSRLRALFTIADRLVQLGGELDGRLTVRRVTIGRHRRGGPRITLFNRSTRSGGLTAVGRQVVEHARVVIAELTALQAFEPKPSTCSG